MPEPSGSAPLGPLRVLLIVDDSAEMTSYLSREIERETGRAPVVATSLLEASRFLSDGTRMYAAVVDFKLPDGEPIMLLASLCRRGVPPCVYTGFPELARDELQAAARASDTGGCLAAIPVFAKSDRAALFDWIADVRRKEHDSDKGRTL